MALIKRGNFWHIRTQIKGVLIAESTHTSNKRLAEQIEARKVAEVFNEVVVAGRKPITVEKAVQLFLESRRGTLGYESAEVKTRMLQPLYKRVMHEVKGSEVTALAKDMVDEGYSINTVNVSIVYFNAIQNHLTKIGYTPCEKIKKLKGGSDRVRFLNDEEVVKLIDALNPKHYREKRKAQDNLDFTMFLLHTGAREREVANLKLNQINQEAGTITIHRSKGGNDTTLRMSNELVEVLARRMVAAEQPLDDGEQPYARTGDGFVFPMRCGTRYNNEFMGKAAAKAGLKDVTIHTMRHTFACKMLRNGLAITEVQHLLGHKNLTSTMCYAHLVPNQTAERAAEVLNAVAAAPATQGLRLVA